MPAEEQCAAGRPVREQCVWKRRRNRQQPVGPDVRRNRDHRSRRRRGRLIRSDLPSRGHPHGRYGTRKYACAHGFAHDTSTICTGGASRHYSANPGAAPLVKQHAVGRTLRQTRPWRGMRIVIAGGTGLPRRSARGGLRRRRPRRPRTDPQSARRRVTARFRAPACPASRASAGSRTARADRGRRRSTAPTRSSTSPAKASATAGGRRSARPSCATAASSRRAAWPPPSAPRPRLRVLVSGSAVGYYGTSGDEPKTESSPARRRLSRAHL